MTTETDPTADPGAAPAQPRPTVTSDADVKAGIARTMDANAKARAKVADTLAQCQALLGQRASFEAKWKDFQDRFDDMNRQLVTKIGASLQGLESGPVCANALGRGETWDGPADFARKVRAVTEAIRGAKGSVVVFTGAGLSTAAGIRDYRSPTDTKLDTGAGEWTRQAESRRKAEQKSVPEPEPEPAGADTRAGAGAGTDGALDAVRPSEGHRAITALHSAGFVKHVVTQNIDGLHLRSGLPRDALSSLHGDLFVGKCASCNKAFTLEKSACPRIGDINARKDMAPGCKFCVGKYNSHCHCIPDSECAACGPKAGPLHNNVVHFGENLDEKVVARAKAEAKAELCIVLGSSCNVAPANVIPTLAKKCAVVNLMATPIDEQAKEHGLERVGGTIDAALRQICADLGVTIPEDPKGTAPARPSATGCLKGSRAAKVVESGAKLPKPPRAGAVVPKAKTHSAVRSSPRAARRPRKAPEKGKSPTTGRKPPPESVLGTTELDREAAGRSAARAKGKQRGVAFGENSVKVIPARGD